MPGADAVTWEPVQLNCSMKQGLSAETATCLTCNSELVLVQVAAVNVYIYLTLDWVMFVTLVLR